MTQAQAFYAALFDNGGYLEQMRQLGVPTEELQRASQMIAVMVGNKDRQTQSMAEKRNSMRQRNLAFAEARQWFAALDKVARIAFREQPALLKAIRPLEVPQGQGDGQLVSVKASRKSAAEVSGTAASEVINAEVAPVGQVESVLVLK